MDSQIEKKRDKDEERQHYEGKLKEGKEEIEQAKQKQVQATLSNLQSSSSSPSHEFSFTISLKPPPTHIATPTDKTKTTSTPSSHALDLSPADDIFFHGHLLPLHLLSHLPVSPRSSTNSLDSFTLPIKELVDRENSSNNNNNNDNSSSNNNNNANMVNRNHENIMDNEDGRIKTRPKAKSFSLFGRSKGQKGNVEKEEKDRQKKKLKFDVSQVLKRYMRMMRPLLSMRNRRESREFHKQPYSFSGNVSFRHDEGFEARRKEFSAPASMWTSPSNSGLLVTKGGASFSTPSKDSSTMEELQAAIQAAIAHCKNSIAMEEKLKCHE